MVSVIKDILEIGFKLLLVGFAAVYIGLVLMSYRVDGPHCPLRLDLRGPARSAERLLIWLGVKTLAGVLRLGRAFFALLAETSADLGEEYVRRRPHGGLAAFRSRFL
jgi:hypothetical protein